MKIPNPFLTDAAGGPVPELVSNLHGPIHTDLVG